MKIIIYQENDPMFRVDDSKKNYDKNSYHKVWEMDWNRYELPSDKNILEALFTTFNQPPYPPSYKGRSLSVGDIVEFRIHENCLKGATKYICANCGWNKVEWK